MCRLRFGRLWWTIPAAILLMLSSGCGGHKPLGASPFAVRVNLVPGPTTSMQQGTVIIFTASAQNAGGTNVRAAFTYISSDTSILNVAPNGAACAGHWDVAFTICTPGGVGVVEVTATANPAASAITLVYVHPPVDNIVVKGILINGLPDQEPCQSQGQTMIVQAYAYSQGNDITNSVGPFSWTANNNSVVTLAPFTEQVVYQNFTFIVATNKATATAVTPGITQIYATVDGVSSTLFTQPEEGLGTFNFYETCPIASIKLEVGAVGSGQTTFVATKGSTTSQTIYATVTDTKGFTSLPNTDGALVLSKIPLTWTSTQPQSVSLAANCTLSCAITYPSTGAAAITASCSPPTCNVGFPYAPAGSFLSLPTYPAAAVSGTVTGSSASAVLLAGSFGCQNELPALCTSVFYSISTTKAQTGTPGPAPFAPNSLLFDLAGDRAYMGSNYGAATVAAGNIGTSSSAFTPIGTIVGNVLAVAPNGNTAVFSDTLQTPNQVYIANASTGAATIVPLPISGATVAAISPDELRTFIFGLDSNANPNLYIYSTLQALQVIPLADPTVNAINFSNNGAFTYVAESSATTASLIAFNSCNISTVNNQIAASLPLPAPPIAMQVTPGNPEQILILDATGIEVVSHQPGPPVCPQTLTLTLTQHIGFNQGAIHPMNFFLSLDGTQLYLVATDRSTIYTYDFTGGGWTGGVELQSNGGSPVTPVSAAATLDGGMIVIAGSDGLLHEVTTGPNGFDGIPLAFPNLANYLNPFCTFTPSQGPCTFNLLAVK